MSALPVPPSRTEQVYEAIVDDICTGRLRPGEWRYLDDREVAALRGGSDVGENPQRRANQPRQRRSSPR